jgi:hypothetical protein
MAFQAPLDEEDDFYLIMVKISQDPEFALNLVKEGEGILLAFLQEMKKKGSLLYELIY